MAEPEYLAEHRASLLEWHRQHGSVPGHSWDRIVDEMDRRAGLIPAEQGYRRAQEPAPRKPPGRPRKARPDGGGRHA